MAAQPRDKSKPEKSQAETKKSETVHLSAEELRAISGGATGVPIVPKPHAPAKQ